MKTSRVVFAMIILPLCDFVWAGSMGTLSSNTWKRVITLSAGPAWTNAGQTQDIFLLPGLSQSYVTDSNTETIGSGEITLSMQHSVSHNIVGQLGIAFAGATSIPVHGEIWQDNDPEFNNFTYRYNINHTHIAVRGKVLADNYSLMQPYLSASLGIGFNHTNQYNSTPKLEQVVAEPPFQSNTNTTFIYTLDAGVQKYLNDYWTIGLGYEFADWGKSQLDAAVNQTAGNGLLQNHIYINQLLISLSFIA